MSRHKLKWSAEQVFDYLRIEFPQAFRDGNCYRAVALSQQRSTVRFVAGKTHLRPGGTVSGPALMQLVDMGIYVHLLAIHAQGARLAVTTNLQISFLRKAGEGALLCHVDMIKHGRTLSVFDVRIVEESTDKLIAHSSATYFMGG